MIFDNVDIVSFFHLISFGQGVPFPQNEANAMDVVIQFATHKLGFQLSDIVVYAWSIGGFTGTPTQFPEQLRQSGTYKKKKPRKQPFANRLCLLTTLSFMHDDIMHDPPFLVSNSAILEIPFHTETHCCHQSALDLYVISFLFLLLFPPFCISVLLLSQLGSDVIPRDPISRVGCLLR